MSKMNLFNFRGLMLGAIAAATFGMAQAHAAPVTVATITDQVDVAAYVGTNNYSGYSSATFANQLRNGHYWGDSIQGSSEPFDSTQIIVTRDDAANTMTFDLKTKFDGNGLGAHYADLFFDTSTPTSPSAFNFSIALGDQTKSAGLYSVGTVATSQDIWKNTGYVYGGGFQFKTTAPGYDANFFSQSPVRLLTGTQQTQYTVAVTKLAPVNGIYDVRVVITSSTNLDLFNNFDIFWGTADCSNDAIWGTVATTSVPAPAGLGLLGLGLMGLAGLGRKRRKA